MGDGEDDEGIAWERVKTALVDEDGIQWDRLGAAVREEIGATDVFGILIVGASLVIILGFSGGAAAVEGILAGVLLTAVFAGVLALRAVSDYYEHDEELAIRELRDRYAAGDLSFEAFQRGVDRLIAGDDDPADVVEGVDDAGTDDLAVDSLDGDRAPAGESGTVPPGDGSRDPVEILRARYARGEIDDAEFERRLARLRETEREATDREFELEE